MTIANLGPTSHSYISQRLKLHYADWGNREAPPLLLVHGGRDHCRSWDWVAQELRHDWHIIAPDLRGHGDSAWSPDGHYSMNSHLYDLAQLVHQLDLAPVTIIAHSLGSALSLRYAGIYPETVRKLVAIEGLTPPPQLIELMEHTPPAERFRSWITDKRAAAGRLQKRYATLEDALARMLSENSYLTEEQARHLTLHGTNQNEDGSWSWKFDNYLNVWAPFDLPRDEVIQLWREITCPVVLMHGEKSWASDPAKDGLIANFQNARSIAFANAGHWLHHDQFDRFITEVRAFI